MISSLNRISVLLFFLLSLFAYACNKSGIEVKATPGTQPGLKASSQLLQYVQADSASTAVTFTYTPSNFGYQAAVNYDLQFSNSYSDKDSLFTAFTDRSMSGTSMGFSVADINSLILGLNYAGGVADTIYVRVKASVADSLYQYSDTIKIVATPYLPAFPMMYVPGAYQPSPNWSPANASIAILYSINYNNIYDGYIHIQDTANGDGQFKITPGQSFDGAYGSADNIEDAGALSTSGGNLAISAPGYYALHVDITHLTWQATLQNWSIIGDFNNWNGDLPFDFDNINQVLVKTVALPVGGFKFRANGSWDVQYGSDGSSINPATGSVGLSSAGSSGNISISAAGTYKITLDLRIPGKPLCTVIKQ